MEARRVYIGGFAGESIVYEWGDDHVVEVVCSHHRYDDVDLERVRAFLAGSEVDAVCEGLMVMSGSFVDRIVACRRRFASMAPVGLQYDGVFIEPAVRTYDRWVHRLGSFGDEPIFTCPSTLPGRRHPEPRPARPGPARTRGAPPHSRGYPRRRGSRGRLRP